MMISLHEMRIPILVSVKAKQEKKFNNKYFYIMLVSHWNLFIYFLFEINKIILLWIERKREGGKQNKNLFSWHITPCIIWCVCVREGLFFSPVGYIINSNFLFFFKDREYFFFTSYNELLKIYLRVKCYLHNRKIKFFRRIFWTKKQ